MKKVIRIFLKFIIIGSITTGIIAFMQDRFFTHQNINKHEFCGIYEKYIKRSLDAILSMLVLIVLSPLLLSVGIAIKVKFGGPVLFIQERPGLNQKIFKILKFRTMLDPQTRDGRKLTDEERIECIKKGIDILSDEERLTGFGRFLRSTSLDELPELINILKGDMAIVGPRPLATIYLPYYTKEERKRHDVRPGLTGLAQINGRNAVSWSERFNYDIEYINNISFINDIKIILKTIAVVIKQKDIGQGKERPEAFNIVRQREWDKGLQN